MNHALKYQDLISRNWAFINDSTQVKIKKTTLLFAGCGLASYIAELAVRTGFTKISLLDNDIVEASNLNRQNYFLNNLGELKTESTQEILKNINPHVEVEKINLQVKDIEEIKTKIKKHKIIINSFDINKVYFDLIKVAGENNSLIILPFNVGFGAFVIALNNKNYKNFIKSYGQSNSDLELLVSIMKSLSGTKHAINVPEYILSNLKNLSENIENKKYNPQLGIASFLSSAVCLSQIISYLDNKKINLFPKINYLDIYNI